MKKSYCQPSSQYKLDVQEILLMATKSQGHACFLKYPFLIENAKETSFYR